MKNAYVAHGENPVLLCSYGETPDKAIKSMAKLIKKFTDEDQNCTVLGINCSYDPEGDFLVSATISTSII